MLTPSDSATARERDAEPVHRVELPLKRLPPCLLAACLRRAYHIRLEIHVHQSIDRISAYYCQSRPYNYISPRPVNPSKMPEKTLKFSTTSTPAPALHRQIRSFTHQHLENPFNLGNLCLILHQNWQNRAIFSQKRSLLKIKIKNFQNFYLL